MDADAVLVKRAATKFDGTHERDSWVFAQFMPVEILQSSYSD